MEKINEKDKVKRGQVSSKIIRPIKWFVLLVLSCFVFVFLWRIIGWPGILALMVGSAGILIFVFHKKDKSIPYISSFLQAEYFRTKFKINILRNKYDSNYNANLWRRRRATNAAHANMEMERESADMRIPVMQRDAAHANDTNRCDANIRVCVRQAGSTIYRALARVCDALASLNQADKAAKPDLKVGREFIPGRPQSEGVLNARGEDKQIRIILRIRIILNRIYFKLLHYLILVTKNSEEGFEILREELQEKNGEVAKVVIKSGDRREVIDIEKVTQRIKEGHIEDVNILNRLLQELFKLHRKKQKKAAMISLAGVAIIIFATVINSLITSLIFTSVNKSNAATYTWQQTNWSTGVSADTASHPGDQSGWAKYAAKDASMIATTSLAVSSSAYNFKDDGATSTTGLATGGGFNNGINSLTQVAGTGAGATVSLDIQKDWQDAIKIANGRWPELKDEKKEKETKERVFEKIYKRAPDMSNAHDNAAVSIITYGLRPAARNTENEKAGIGIFKRIYGKNPISASDWDVVRAIAYSGAKR